MENTSKKSMLTNTPLIPFILVTVLFFAWGVPNNMTEPLITAFKDIFKDMSLFEASLVQSAFYGAYFVWAIPAALLVRKTSYKATLMFGILLFAVGAALFYPASNSQQFYFFLIALFTLAAGLSFLETAANPYIVAMGDEETSVRRLNLAQSFNPLGSLTGHIIVTYAILKQLATDDQKVGMTAKGLAELQTNELVILAQPYIYIAVICVVFLIIFALTKMPNYQHNQEEKQEGFFCILCRIFKKRRYILSVAALFSAMCAQFGTFAFAVPYLKENYIENGALVSSGRASEILLIGIILFAVMRFVCTGLMKFIQPSKLLTLLSFMATLFIATAIIFPGNIGGIAIILTCGCASLLFPTIYGLGLQGLSEEETKVGASGLIMAIIAIAIMNPLQAKISSADYLGSISLSYICVVIAFIVLVAYGKNIEKFSNHSAK